MSTRREIVLSTEPWELATPFRITDHVFSIVDMLHVRITENGASGCGEATGVYYLKETGDSILAQAEAVRNALRQGADRERLRRLLPAGGARNAIDCALWDLEAKKIGRRVWEIAGIEPHRVRTFYTVGIDTPEIMARTARDLSSNKIKVKLSGDDPLVRISAVREARPQAEIIVDVNQGWDFAQLVELAPRFKALGVGMIEQPLPRGKDQELEGYDSPVPLCADESCLDSSEFEQASRRYQVINIKLDKAGGLTEALEIAGLARSRGLDLMIGNMVGTSLGMAPGYVIAQLCKYVDLDGALFLKRDREHSMNYDRGVISEPERELWG